jgi:hypothetical protein
MSELMEVKNVVANHKYDCEWWIRGTPYTDTALRDADIFVLIPRSYVFDFTMDYMTTGCKKELQLAYELGKPLYMAYRKKSGQLNIYPISLDSLKVGRVRALSGKYLRKNEVINNYEIY